MRRAIVSLLLVASQAATDCPPKCSNDVCRTALRPCQLQTVPVYTAWVRNHTLQPPGSESLHVAEGSVNWPQLNGITSAFAVLPGIARPDEVQAVLAMVQADDAALPFDSDSDSVDGMPTFEFFIEANGNGVNMVESATPGRADKNKLNTHPSRRPIREKLRALMQPIVNNRITPYVRHRFAKECGRGKGRNCQPCYSLIRRYLPDERRSHASHHDAHALVTVVVSLSSWGRDYAGGLYVESGQGSRQTIALHSGDAIVHQPDLLHGVHVTEGARWSWILWYRDSDTCEEHGHEWFHGCADEGNPICQIHHVLKLGSMPGMNDADMVAQAIALTQRAADGGLGSAMNRIAKAYLKKLPSSLPYDPAAATRLYRQAADPESYYLLAQLLLEFSSRPEQLSSGSDRIITDATAEAVTMFEAAAVRGHAAAMYNLGVAHLYGFGVPTRDPQLASEWFLASGLPEGLWAASLHRTAVGNADEGGRLAAQARRLGFGSGGRQELLAHVNLHSPWPDTSGPRPPEW